ncbi:penicillin-binding transpeptidase domain-containing protein [Clostridium intestinale]|uniref:peptidoglycan D,D-transpeptidase FtsI family protein n=1 Tax=Clostridium intestinale TaxID=36845 RepID=UPI0028EABC90|nr:penicillin-binding transpeptidase domain-containing protein [Clostridium intestinale]
MNKKKKKFNRYTALIMIMFFIFSAILGRLIYLQIVKYDDYKDLANTKSRRFIAENAPRGIIYDEKGNVLATNVQSYTVTFTSTEESNAAFYDTMSKTFKLLDENGQKIQDEMQLMLNENKEFYFDFKTSDQTSLRALNIRFKKDKGIDSELRKQLFPGKEGDLTSGEQNQLDDAIFNYSPQDTFYYMVKSYAIYDILKPTKEESKEYSKMSGKEILDILLQKYSLEEIRKYIVIKDAIKMQSFKGYKPIVIANIDRNTSFIFYQKRNDMPGIDVSMEPVRSYPYDSLASSVLGYIGSIDGSQQTKYDEKGYDANTDKIGKAGIESAFESILKGTKGGTTVKVNSSGRKTEELFKLEASPGNNLHLTIDKNIQYSAEKMLEHQLKYYQNVGVAPDGSIVRNATRGAVVAIEVKTGRVVALANYPSYNPNDFSIPGKLTPELSKMYFSPDLEAFGNEYIRKNNLNKTIDDLFPKDSNGYRQDQYDLYPKPFYNYASMGLTPPGSIFKPLTAVAALEEGVFGLYENVYAKHSFDTRPDYFGKVDPPKDDNWRGAADVRRALEVSSNTFFYEAGIRLYEKYGGTSTNKSPAALDSLAKWAWRFGLGVDPTGNQKASTGIEIAENFGQVYNFISFKNRSINSFMFNIVEFAENGTLKDYKNTMYPMDLAKNDSDDDKLKEAKENVKNIIKENLQKVGTDAELSQNDSKIDLMAKLKPAIQEIYDNSPKYQEKVKNANVTPKTAITSAANEIAHYVVYSAAVEIKAVAQISYASIGQSMNAFTPLQLASYISTLTNGGTRYKVHLVDKITDSQGNVVEEFKPEVLDQVNISQSTLQAVKDGMKMANGSNQGGGGAGTAASTFQKLNSYLSSGGKTGTATFSDEQDKIGRAPYGVYVGVAPIEDPQIAVAVVLYDAAHGSYAAPVARAIFETYFRDDLKAKGYVADYSEEVGGKYDYTLNPPLQDNNTNTQGN